MNNNYIGDIRKKSGIYFIKSSINGKIYIGSAKNLLRRYHEHKSSLLKGIHKAFYMQRHFIKHGNNSLFFSVFEFCEVKNLIIREQYYIDLLLPIVPNGFNTRIKAESNLGCKKKPLTEEQRQNCIINSIGRLHTTESKILMSQKAMGNKRNQGNTHSAETRLKISIGHSISIDQLSISGDVIKSWPSAKEAGKILKINYKNINSVTHGKRHTAGNFKWKFTIK